MPFSGFGPAQVVGTTPPVNPLLVARVLYVNSATGSNSNPGTQALPYQTFARAWAERNKYSELDVAMRVQLIGAGPYDLPNMGFSACGAAGSFIICGDSAVESVIATGTATGDFAGLGTCVLPTSATGGVNNLRDDFLRITSGNCNGSLFQINENAANSITITNPTARTSNGAVVNGDTWQVVRPGTEVRIASTGTPALANGIDSWIGGNALLTGGQGQPKHWFYNIRFTTADASRLSISNSLVGLTMVRAETGSAFANSIVVCGTTPQIADFGIISAQQNILYAAGLVCTGSIVFCFNQTQLQGIIAAIGAGGLSLFSGRLLTRGGRFSTIVAQFGSSLNSSGGDVLLNGTVLLVGSDTVCRFAGSTQVRCAVTTGSCFLLRRGAVSEWTLPATQPIGGTTDAAGFAHEVRGGGRVFFINGTPVLLGGTVGADLRTSNVILNNGILGANGTPGGNAADALLGESIARLAS